MDLIKGKLIFGFSLKTKNYKYSPFYQSYFYIKKDNNATFTSNFDKIKTFILKNKLNIIN